MNKIRMKLNIFEGDANLIDRTGAESLIPVQEANEIIQGTITQSAVLSRGRKLANMTSKQYKVPVLDMLPIAYFVNGDTGQKKTSKMAWDKKFIVAEEIAVIVPIPEAVLDDSEYDIWAEVKPRITEAFGKVIDGAILFDAEKPSTWRDGLVATATKAGTVVTLNTQDDLFDKIMAEDGVIAKVEDCGYFVNGHMADISMRAKLRGLKDNNGQPLFKSDMKLYFGDATSITVQSVKELGGMLSIKTIGNTPDQLRVLFTDALKTKYMRVEERGKTIAEYEGYTEFYRTEEYTGQIYGVVVNKVGESVEERLASAEQTIEQTNTDMQMAVAELTMLIASMQGGGTSV